MYDYRYRFFFFGTRHRRRQQRQHTTSHISTYQHAQTHTAQTHHTSFEHLSTSSTETYPLHSKWHDACTGKPNSQRIDDNTDATNNTTTTTMRTQLHHNNITYQHTPTRTNTHSTDTSHPSPAQIQAHFIPSEMFAQQGMGQSTCTLALKASQSRLHRGSQPDESSLSSSLNKEDNRQDKERHEKR